MRREKRENEVVSCACRQLASGNKNLVHVTASSQSCRHMRHGKCGFVINGTGKTPHNFRHATSSLRLLLWNCPTKKACRLKIGMQSIGLVARKE
jgi:hypothetical protein